MTSVGRKSGFTNDGEDVAGQASKSPDQKVNIHELMPGQILRVANYSLVISRINIVNTSMFIDNMANYKLILWFPIN